MAAPPARYLLAQLRRQLEIVRPLRPKGDREVTAEAQRVTTNRMLSARGQRLRAHPVRCHILSAGCTRYLASRDALARRSSCAVLSTPPAALAVVASRSLRRAQSKLSPDGADRPVDDGERRSAVDARSAPPRRYFCPAHTRQTAAARSVGRRGGTTDVERASPPQRERESRARPAQRPPSTQ